MHEHVINNQADINHILEEKLRSYAEFLAATLRLKDAFEAEDMGKVEQLTVQREDMIRFVNGLDYQVNQTYRDKGGGGKKQSVIADALNEILQRINAANKDCEKVATLKLNLAMGDLAAIHRQEKVMSGYASKPRGIPKFLDVRT